MIFLDFATIFLKDAVPKSDSRNVGVFFYKNSSKRERQPMESCFFHQNGWLYPIMPREDIEVALPERFKARSRNNRHMAGTSLGSICFLLGNPLKMGHLYFFGVSSSQSKNITGSELQQTSEIS